MFIKFLMDGILSFCVSVGNNNLFICQTSFSILAMRRQVLRKVWGYWEFIRDSIFS